VLKEFRIKKPKLEEQVLLEQSQGSKDFAEDRLESEESSSKRRQILDGNL
jgi:hypothetical protein